MEGASLRAAHAAALGRLKEIKAQYVALGAQLYAAQSAARTTKAALDEYPTRLYWSNLSTRRLPMEVVHTIVSKSDQILWKLYRSTTASMKLLIDPRQLQLLHVKFIAESRSFLNLRRELATWLYANQESPQYTSRDPKWKRRVESANTKGLVAASDRRPIRLTLGSLTAVLFGPRGLVEIEGLVMADRVRKVTAEINRRLTMVFERDPATGGLCVPYRTLGPGFKVVYGGQPKGVVVVKI